MIKFVYLLILLLSDVIADDNDFDPVGSPLLIEYPCHDTKDIVTWFDPGLPPREKNRYYVIINKYFAANSVIQVAFDSDVNIMHRHQKNKKLAKIFVGTNETLTLTFVTPLMGFGFIVKGVVPGTNPYFESLTINGEEVCNQPNVGYLEEYIAGTLDKGPQGNCGRRKVDHTELIVKGVRTKPGDWPWHAAIFKLKNEVLQYMCGGTLISKNYLLSAGHCVTVKGVPVVPSDLNVVLGKYNLIGGDVGTQEREVHKIIVHESFNYTNLNNDISLLKFKSEAIFTDYVQPACLWFSKADNNRNDNLATGQIFGTVVGWGYDSNNALTHQLRQAKMPIVSENTCIKSHPLFYANVLNGNKFCAGYHNGTSACNGDSGSAFQVFVADKKQDSNSITTGSWYVRGIVSVAVASADHKTCDPKQYVVFTDVEKYRLWIDAYLENERN
ncbi:chymotrypsin-like elastase family member 2A [Nymphalis io]|uniref:chymotrypsin-like elastase family member 2A n=1 Tax=Inachis io TaxID=171585 RepID=UPI002168FF09|nr:chymotrypsin-like elastase family member 2A [Nymphalis io]